MTRHLLTIVLSLILTTPMVWANDDVSGLTQVIDRLIEERHQSESVSPTELVDDYLFARRVTLDLAGRVPTKKELLDFVDSKSIGKRPEYVGRLLDSPDFAYHLRNTLDALLLAQRTKDDAWREYLLEATSENRSWDRIFREIMLPERERAEDKRPAAFLHARTKMWTR